MLSRRSIIAGAGALAACSQIEDAAAINRLLLLSGGIPSWVPNRTNPPDFAVNWAIGNGGVAWKKGGGLLTPSALGITTSRASVKQVSDANGNWSQVAANVTATSALGRSTEEARTNSIRNNSMVGAASGSPGTLPTNWSASATGLTVNVVNTGVVSGINFVDLQFVGTTGAGYGTFQFENGTTIAASNGQTWSSSVFLALVGGSFTNVSSLAPGIQESSSGGSFLQNDFSSNITVTGSFSRFTSTTTLSNASTVLIHSFFQFGWSNGVAVNFTLRIGWPQLELGASVTSPIVTSGTALTRAADVTTMPIAVGGAYTLFEQATPQSPTSYSTNQTFLELSNGGGLNQFGMFRLNGSGNGNFFMSGGSSWNATGGSLPQNSVLNIAASNNGSAQNGSVNALLVAAGANTASLTINQLGFGSAYDGSQFINGLAQIDAVWLSKAVPNSQLMAMV